MDEVRLANWAGNHAYVAARLHEPGSVEHLQEIVRESGSLRALGSRHSFNEIADTTGDLVSLARMPRIVEIDRVAATVRVDGGIRYGELCGQLDAAGFALHSLASLPHISIAGACATATHGSGDRTRNLATAVTALEVVSADGEIRRLARDRDADDDDFLGCVVSLGGLGVVTALTLELQPAFRMRQDVYQELPLSQLVDHFDEITASADSVSLFTAWRRPSFEQVWLKRIVREGDGSTTLADLFGATLATMPLHPIPRMPADSCTEQLGVVGPWHERLPHFRMEHRPSSGAELQSEYLVPRRHGVDALLALDGIRDRFGPVVQVSEVRTVAADDLWMSPSFARPSVTIHFTWVPDWDAVGRVLPMVEDALLPFEPRPHWGKLFTMQPESVRAAYEKRPAFRELLGGHDPEGKFRNAFLDRYVFDGR